AVPNGGATGLLVDGAQWMHISLPLHFWFFDSKTLTALLEQHGFTPVRPPYSTNRTYYLERWLRCIRTDGPIAATRAFARHLLRSLSVADGGDVLRIVAARN